MAVIVESYFLAASNTDILAAPSRLASIPEDGVLVMEASATDCDGTNYGELTVQPPGSEIPLDTVIIPQNGFSTADAVIHDDTAFVLQIPVEAGGHVLVSYVENGTVAAMFIVFTLQF